MLLVCYWCVVTCCIVNVMLVVALLGCFVVVLLSCRLVVVLSSRCLPWCCRFVVLLVVVVLLRCA